MKYYKRIKINLPVHGLRAGDEVRIQTDREGTPLEQKWRNRFKDVSVDNCISVLSDKPPIKKKKKDE